MQGYYQFVTFRTKDSIDSYVSKVQNLKTTTKIKEQLIDNYLDKSTKGAYFYGELIDILREFLLQKNIDIYELVAFSIMPNHIHILFKEKEELQNIIKQIKGGSSYLINKKLNRKTSLWSKYYYDKLIRDKKHFDLVYNYIKNNAVKAGLADYKNRFYGVYE